jgi:hypothetical protein
MTQIDSTKGYGWVLISVVYFQMDGPQCFGRRCTGPSGGAIRYLTRAGLAELWGMTTEDPWHKTM